MKLGFGVGEGCSESGWGVWVGWDGIDWVFDDELLFHFLFYFREAMVLWEGFHRGLK